MHVARVLSAAALLLAPVLAAPAMAELPSGPPARYIVVLDGSVRDPAAVAREHTAAAGTRARHVYRTALKGYSATLPASRVSQLRADPRVDAVVPDTLGGPHGKGGNKSGGGTTTTQRIPTGIDRINGSGTPPSSVDADIATVDSGVQASHPDLDVRGGKWCGENTAAGWETDAHGHGTHVAGTAAAKNNDIGVVGAAPGARLWSLRLPNAAGEWWLSAVVCSIDWITAQTDADGGPMIEAVNMSIGWQSYHLGFTNLAGDQCGLDNDDVLHAAICAAKAAGITLIASAGNSAADVQQKAVPGGYDEVITVSALADFDGQPGGLIGTTNTRKYCRADVDDTAADFSNYGLDVDIMAPGVCILSTLKDGGYGMNSGTSMSAPHVTGAAAVLAAEHPQASPDDIQARLVSSTDRTYSWPNDPDGVQEPLLTIAGLTGVPQV